MTFKSLIVCQMSVDTFSNVNWKLTVLQVWMFARCQLKVLAVYEMSYKRLAVCQLFNGKCVCVCVGMFWHVKHMAVSVASCSIQILVIKLSEVTTLISVTHIIVSLLILQNLLIFIFHQIRMVTQLQKTVPYLIWCHSRSVFGSSLNLLQDQQLLCCLILLLFTRRLSSWIRKE